MTCEVAVMNQLAVALAADSATTITDQIRGKWETRYSKGGNKIFQLSHHEPVAAMIYSSATLQNIPWELIFKTFRDTLKATSYPTLSEYVTHFFAWLQGCQELFPTAKRQSDDQSTYYRVAGGLIRAATDANPKLEDATTPLTTRQADWATYVAGVRSRLQQVPPIFPGGDPQHLQDALTNYAPQLANDIAQAVATWPVAPAIDIAELASVTIEAAFREHNRWLPDTGLVFAGYGKNEYFPGLEQHVCYGFFDDVLVREAASSVRITDANRSAIEAFATTSTVDTFMMGFGWELVNIVAQEYRTSATKLVTDVITAGGAAVPADLGALVNTSHLGFRKAWQDRIFEEHYQPLKTVIASLPIEEMAELAENLVMLESLKEKVSTTTSSVSGPFDVAVITKSEGLVWIKRKLYFDAAKNPRYFERQRVKYQP